MEKRPVASQTQAAPGSSPKSRQVPAILQLACKAELTLETITPHAGLGQCEGPHHPVPEG